MQREKGAGPHGELNPLAPYSDSRPQRSGPDGARYWTGDQKSEVVQTLAKSLAAFCRYCQSIHVPRLFMTLS